MPALQLATFEHPTGELARRSTAAKGRWVSRLTLLVLFLPAITQMGIWRPTFLEATGLTLGGRQTAELLAVGVQVVWTVLLLLGIPSKRRPEIAAIGPYVLVLLAIVAINYHVFSAFTAVAFVNGVFLVHAFLGRDPDRFYARCFVLLGAWASLYLGNALLASAIMGEAQLKTNTETLSVAAAALIYLSVARLGWRTLLAVVAAAGFAAMGLSLTVGLGFLFASTVVLVKRMTGASFLFVLLVLGAASAILLSAAVLAAKPQLIDGLALLTGRPPSQIASFTGRAELWSLLYLQFLDSPFQLLTGLGLGTAERIELVGFFGQLRALQEQAGLAGASLVPLFQHSHNFILSALLNGGILWLAALLYPIVVAVRTLGRRSSEDRMATAMLGLLVMFAIFSVTAPGYARRFELSYLLVALPLHYAWLVRHVALTHLEAGKSLAGPTRPERTR
jgi:O-antigen ligase